MDFDQNPGSAGCRQASVGCRRGQPLGPAVCIADHDLGLGLGLFVQQASILESEKEVFKYQCDAERSPHGTQVHQELSPHQEHPLSL